MSSADKRNPAAEVRRQGRQVDPTLREVARASMRINAAREVRRLDAADRASSPGGRVRSDVPV
jgi:hypothetical protein